MRAFTFGLALLLLAAPAFPTEIPASLRSKYEARDEFACKLPSSAVKLLDLQGDGTPYFIVDDGKLKCKQNPFCGSGGCSISVYGRKHDLYKLILEDLVEHYFFSKQGRGFELFVEYKTVGTARYRFENDCAQEVGTNKAPSC